MNGRPRQIAVVPAYNEEPTIGAVVERLYELVDELVVVDDGSTDKTRAVVEALLPGRDRARLLTFDSNQGMSAAYYRAFCDLRSRLEAGEVDPDDLVFTVDADGQHDLDVLEQLTRVCRSESLDALLARRDLSSYPPHKRLGNWLLSAWASLWAGHRFDDVESGYRIFRVGALADALDYYEGYRYSETVEVAVVMCRLGYRVRNDIVVPVPLFRSRTRLIDAGIDFAVIPAAAWRVARGRRSRNRARPASAGETARSAGIREAGEMPATGLMGHVAVAILAIGWVVMLGLILRRSLFVSLDSISNYGHVWYVQDRIWHHHHFPFSMPVIGHGQGLAFPYALIPWLTAALFWPLLGNWVVTLWLVLGTVALLGATYWAFPELRSGWWAAAVLVNPALVVAPIIGQLPFIWATAMLCAGVGCWRRRRYLPAAILVGLGQATHPAVVLPMGVLLVACWWHWEPDRRSLLRYYAVSLVIAVPATWSVFASPVVADSSTAAIAGNLVGTLAARGLVLLVPIGLVLLRRNRHALQQPLHLASGLAPLSFAALLALNVGLMGPLHERYAWAALQRRPNTELLAFLRSSDFVPGATYRLLRDQDDKVGMYQLEQHGARLDSEFFPESMARRSWPSVAKYSAFLRKRRVDFVVIFDTYDRRRRTNEHALLRSLEGRRPFRCDPERVGVRRVKAARDFEVYRILRACGTAASARGRVGAAALVRR